MNDSPEVAVQPDENMEVYDLNVRSVVESKMISRAKRELELAGYFNDTDELGEEMNLMMADNVLELLNVFSKQGHSGFSAHYCISLFSKLAKQEVLSPLTGEDHEWVEVAEQNGGPLYQNNRDSRVFKDPTRAYFIDGIVWEDRDGCTYTNRDSFVTIESFPYTPKTEYRKDYEDDGDNASI